MRLLGSSRHCSIVFENNCIVARLRYWWMLTDILFLLELNAFEMHEVYFQQDEAKCGISNATKSLLRGKLSRRIISRRVDVNWPPIELARLSLHDKIQKFFLSFGISHHFGKLFWKQSFRADLLCESSSLFIVTLIKLCSIPCFKILGLPLLGKIT